MSRSRPTVIDFFSGAGGLSLGFRAAGCHILAAVEANPEAGRSFAENFARLQPEARPEVFSGPDGDLEQPDLLERVDKRVGKPDIVVGGPPCQGFSRIGRAKLASLIGGAPDGPKRKEDLEKQNRLYHRFLEATRLWQPRAVVMENVPGMLSIADRNLWADAAGEVASYGYRVGYAVLNAAWYGVPQFRERLFFIGIRVDLDTSPVMPLPTHRAEVPSGYLKPLRMDEWEPELPFVQHFELPVDLDHGTRSTTTVYEALDDLPALQDHLEPGSEPRRGDFRRKLEYRREPHSPYARLMRRWPGFPETDSVFDHVIRRTPRDYEIFRRMRPGDRYPEALDIARDRLQQALASWPAGSPRPEPDTPEYEDLLTKLVPPYPESIFVDKWRKLIPDQPSRTVPAHLAKDTYSHIHYDSDQARTISIREAARLQSFPDAFQFIGNMGDCYRQIGNAVPPLMAWAIAYTLIKSLGLVGHAAPWEAVPIARVRSSRIG